MYKPNTQINNQFGTEDADVIQAPPRVQVTVEASKQWFDQNVSQQQVAEHVVNYYLTNIERFIDTQRQQYAVAGVQQRRTQMTAPGLQMDYTRNTGAEEIRMTVFPESAPQQAISSKVVTENDFDGYIAFRMVGGPTSSSLKIQFFMNGIQVGPSFFTSFVQAGGPVGPSDAPPTHGPSGPRNHSLILLTFGKTAMKCHSLNDVDNPNKTLVNAILPPRPDIPAIRNPDGFLIPAHKDLFGYFPYNWLDPVNWPTYYPIIPGAQVYPTNPYPQLILELDYPDMTKTAFKINNGLNNFRVVIGPEGPPGDSIEAVYEIFAEFYSRASKRPVSTSWTLSDDLPDIHVNDKPRWWDIMYNVVGYVEVNKMDLNFDPTMTDENAAGPAENLIQIRAQENAAEDFTGVTQELTSDIPNPLPPTPKGNLPIAAAPIVITVPRQIPTPIPPPVFVYTFQDAWAAVTAMFATTGAYAVGYRLVDTPMSQVPSANAEIYYVYDQDHVFWTPAG